MGNAISDEELISWIMAGKQEAVSQLIGRYQDFAFNLSMKILRNREDAEESVQDSFVKAIKAIRAFRQDSSFKTWLYRIVYNTSVNRLRQNKKDRFIPFEDITEDLVNSSETQENKYDQMIWVTRIKEAFNTLSTENRVIMSLYYVEQMPIDEIAEIVLLKSNLVKVRIHRCREQLRPLLDGLKDIYKTS